MKKLIVAAFAVAALALPAAPALAGDIPPPAGTERCPAPYTGGFILWVDTGPTGYHEEWFCIPGGPGVATADDGSARAGVSRCETLGGGYRGVYAWWYDLDNNYHRTNTCVYVGP